MALEMSRVKSLLTFEDFNSKRERNVLRTYLVELIIFDLWAILKVRQILNIFSKLLRPILEITCLMALGAGLLYISTHNSKNNAPSYGVNSGSKESIPRLDDHSATRTNILEKELFKLRSKTLSLDLALRRIDTQLQNLHVREGVKDAELADFAAEAVGGCIIATPDTESFYELNSGQVTLFGIPLWKPNYFTPRKVIQPWTEAGECWAFRGSHGKIEIELPYAAMISHVTMEHIPVSLSISETIDSAPKDFKVLGKFRNKYVMIDKFVYSINGQPSQTFPIKREDLWKVPFKTIMLEVLSNWGNLEYTCIYRFKVHGKMFNYLEHPSKSKKDKV